MENPAERILDELAKIEKRISTMEGLIVQLFRLYNDLAIDLEDEKYKQPPGNG